MRRVTLTMDHGEHIGALVYTYDHGIRELPKRLTKGYYDHRAARVAAEHGVRYGRLVLAPVTGCGPDSHAHKGTNS